MDGDTEKQESETSQIQLKKTTIAELHNLKALGESYDDVVIRLLKNQKITKQKTKEEKS